MLIKNVGKKQIPYGVGGSPKHKANIKQSRRASLPRLDQKYYQHIPQLRHKAVAANAYQKKDNITIRVKRFQSEDVEEVVEHIIGQPIATPHAKNEITVSFGRHESVPKDRVNERMLIKEKKDKINRIINAGLRREGIIVSNVISVEESRKTSSYGDTKFNKLEPSEWVNDKLPTLGRSGFGMQKSPHDTQFNNELEVNNIIHAGETFSPEGIASPLRVKLGLDPITTGTKSKFVTTGLDSVKSPSIKSPYKRKGRNSIVASTLMPTPAPIQTPSLSQIKDSAVRFHRINPEII